MPLISRLKIFMHNRAMRKFRTTNLNKVPDNHFSTIKSVGILFLANDAKECDVVFRYRDQLEKTGFQVWPFGYFNFKVREKPTKFDFIDLTNLSFAYIPASDKITQFITKPFDVLINLDTASHRPLNYIAAASKALFKIGPAHGNHAHYDLMIDMHEHDLARYIQDIRTTFNKIQG